jgi:hypothetical protein
MGSSIGDEWKGIGWEGSRRDDKRVLEEFRALTYFRVKRSISHCSTVTKEEDGVDFEGTEDEEGLAEETIFSLEAFCFTSLRI